MSIEAIKWNATKRVEQCFGGVDFNFFLQKVWAGEGWSGDDLGSLSPSSSICAPKLLYECT